MHIKMPVLQDHIWPPVDPHDGYPDGFLDFLGMDTEKQRQTLAELRGRPDAHGAKLHGYLSTVSAYIFGYQDSPVYGRLDDEFETAILRAKITLERELIDHWLDAERAPTNLSQVAAVQYLDELIGDNTPLSHPLFDFIRDEASQRAIAIFLRNEVARNEVVDDEVAMMLAGLQGPMKLAIASNLWDECGRGKLSNFHTYWLRRLLEHTDDWDGIKNYRSTTRPWITQITTNVFNILLTRSGVRLRAFGWFLTNESWVAPHFVPVLEGIRRVGLSHDDVNIYFDAHVSIDPRHTAELLEAVRMQSPALSPAQTTQLIQGAQMAVAASTAQYDRMLAYLKGITAGDE